MHVEIRLACSPRCCIQSVYRSMYALPRVRNRTGNQLWLRMTSGNVYTTSTGCTLVIERVAS